MTAPAGPREAHDEPVPAQALETAIAALLRAGTLAGVALLLGGVVLMAVAGIDPTRAPAAPFDATRLVPDLLAGRPEGFLWAGIVVLVATPIARVIGELVAFAYRRDGLMAMVAVAILGIIALSVALAAL